MEMIVQTKLQNQVRQYGLNPQEWQLKPLSTSKVLFVKQKDESLQIIGSVEKGQITHMEFHCDDWFETPNDQYISESLVS